MKIFVSLLFTSILFIISCETNTAPEFQEHKNNLTNIFTEEEGSKNPLSEYDLIPMPVRSPIFLDSVFAITKTILGELGGQITLERTYISNRGRLVTMLVDLVIPPNCFKGLQTITLKADKDFAIVHCNPDMNFKMPLHLVQTFSGLDLQGYQTGDIDFVYIKEDGKLEVVDRTAIVVIKSLGIVTVLDAKLNHFSRYGWVRKNE